MTANANTDLCMSTYSMSPEKEKNSLISCSDAPKETLLTLTVLTCNNVKKLNCPENFLASVYKCLTEICCSKFTKIQFQAS